MQKDDNKPKLLSRRLSIFTASQTLRAVAGFSNRVRGDRRDSKGGSLHRRDSVRTDGSSLQQQQQSTQTKQAVRLENTYKMAPDSRTEFEWWKAKKVVDDVLKEMLQGRSYDPAETAKLCLQVASVLKQYARDGLGCPRHKFVSHVIIGQAGEQSVQSASRCLWNGEWDGFACGTFRNESLFAVATLYALYAE